jgi:hypothetical protein
MKMSSMFPVVTLVVLANFATPNQLIAEEYTPFTKTELETLLTGKTYPLVRGGFYFKDATTMIALWKGEIEETTWRATDESSICYNLEMFGGEECLGIFKRGEDQFVQVFEDNERIWNLDDIKDGRTF